MLQIKKAERRTERCSPRFRPIGPFWNRGSDTCRQAVRERNVGPLTMCDTSLPFVLTSHFYINIKVSQLFLPSGTCKYAFVWWVFDNCACAFWKHSPSVWERQLKLFRLASILWVLIHIEIKYAEIFYAKISEKVNLPFFFCAYL